MTEIDEVCKNLYDQKIFTIARSWDGKTEHHFCCQECYKDSTEEAKDGTK